MLLFINSCNSKCTALFFDISRKASLNSKDNKCFFIISFLLLFLNNIPAQKLDVHQFYIAKGQGFSKTISSNQIMLMQKFITLYEDQENIYIENNLVFELITESGRTNYLMGTLPLIKWNFNLVHRRFVVLGGIGFNYISTDKLGGRNLGGKLIFSDMIGVGVNVCSFYEFVIDVYYLFRHISNAGFYEFNDGFNSQYLMFSLRL